MTKIAYYAPMYDPTDFLTPLRAFPDMELQIARRGEDVREVLAGAEIFITGNGFYDADSSAIVRKDGRALRWINFVTSGVDNAFKYGLPPGVVVTNVAGIRAFAVAEHSFALMLGLARHLRMSETARLNQHWVRGEITPLMTNLSRRRLVIVGIGSVGQEIARLAKAFHMHVTGISRTTSSVPNFDEIRPREALVDVARGADYLLVAALAGPTTERIISSDVIAALRPTAFLVNVARGSLVDEAALMDALNAGRIAGAGLDVTATEPLPPDHPFWAMKNVLLTPHVGGPGDRGVTTEASSFIENLQRWRSGETLRNIVANGQPG